jgi:hypothetical protein
MGRCPRRRRGRLVLFLLLLSPLLLFSGVSPALPAAPERVAVAAPLACPASPGRGAARYARGGAGGPPAPRRDGGACLVRHAREGRTGNQLVNYFVARLYAELHGCYAAPVPDFGGGAGGEGAPPASGWPLPVGVAEAALGAPVDATAAPGAPLRALFEGGSAASLALGSQLERADVVYAAASLGWDLGVGGSLMGAGGGVAEPVAALREGAVEERAAAWAAEREACWAERDARSLHPWAPAGVRRMALAALGATAGGSGGGAGNGASGALPAGLLAVAASPADTIVVHARLGDMSAMAWQEAVANAGAGHGGVWRGRAGVGWSWVPERFPRYRYPAFPDCEKLRGEAAYAEGGGMVEALEVDAARTGGFVVSPLSFYEAVLEGTRGGRGGWARVVVLTESCSVDHPIVRALVSRYGAIVQAGTVAEDFATLALAREVVVSSSTFSYMAAVVGRARAIHAPVAGSLVLVGAHAGQCLPPPAGLDARWVFHDVFRRAADAADVLLRGGGSPWLRRAEGAGPLPPPRPAACPHSAPPSERGAAWGWVRRGGAPPPPRPPPAQPLPPAPASEPMPYYFLSWEQLAGFYRNPACSGYYFPPADDAAAAAVESYVAAHGVYPICSDTDLSLYKGEARPLVALQGID